MISLKGMKHVFSSGSKHKVSIQVQNCISTNTINFLRNKEHISFRIKKVDPSNSIIVIDKHHKITILTMRNNKTDID